MSKLTFRSVLLLHLVFMIAVSSAWAQDHAKPKTVPLRPPRAGPWFERVWGDPDVPGKPFVARIHADAGYIILPHVHAIDENVVVLQGTWGFGMGSHFDRSALELIEVGGFAFGPKDMPHFGWSKTETTIQIHGVGPFSVKLIDPAYDLTDKGVFLLNYLLRPGTPIDSAPDDCFPWKLGTRVRGKAGEGVVIEARCSPANHLTQYWVRGSKGEQFWAPGQELKTIGQ
ncbi:MAG: cupin domain-containing protein [Acidobacteriota bacterium]